MMIAQMLLSGKKYHLRGQVLSSPIYGKKCRPIDATAAAVAGLTREGRKLRRERQKTTIGVNLLQDAQDLVGVLGVGYSHVIACLNDDEDADFAEFKTAVKKCVSKGLDEKSVNLLRYIRKRYSAVSVLIPEIIR